MIIALLLVGFASLLEVLLWGFRDNSTRSRVAALAMILLACGSTLLLLSVIGPWSLLVVFLGIYRIVNLLRVLRRRIQPDYLFYVGRRSSIWLMSMQAAVLLLTLLVKHNHWSTRAYTVVGLAGQLLALAVLHIALLRQWRAAQPAALSHTFADRDLPTLTLAIPARNETDDLEACLYALVQSTYPKLEVLVLDDCSQNSRTPEIIRAFAHDGVRFIAGTPPPENWLAKNFAYQQLADASNGELIMFCGVDARFMPDSLRQMVATLLEQKKTMLSWLPVNLIPVGLRPEMLFVQSSRYGWELTLPRWLLKRPPVLSTSWLIVSEQLRAAGGFKAVSHSISPENYFARLARKELDGYSFLAAKSDQLVSAKTLAEQRATAIRTRYPQLHRRLELVCAVSLIETGLFVAPFVSVVINLLHGNRLGLVLSLLAMAGAASLYSRLVTITYRHFLLSGIWLAPFAAIYDVALLNYSLAKYEFGEVIWKGRNVCIPVMRIIPKLPPLS
jgi:hypothetical protein